MPAYAEELHSQSVSRLHIFQPPRAGQMSDSDRPCQHPASLHTFTNELGYPGEIVLAKAAYDELSSACILLDVRVS
jgi:hypothetical protein